jgi:hypothetical protein
LDEHDLTDKIQALMLFAAELGASGGGVDGLNDYGEQLFVNLCHHDVEEQDDDRQDSSSFYCRRKSLEILWCCPGLDGTSPVDLRDHEALLRRHFVPFSVVVRKGRRLWTVKVHTRPLQKRDGAMNAVKRRVLFLPSPGWTVDRDALEKRAYASDGSLDEVDSSAA